MLFDLFVWATNGVKVRNWSVDQQHYLLVAHKNAKVEVKQVVDVRISPVNQGKLSVDDVVTIEQRWFGIATKRSPHMRQVRNF
ncbi:hypothetical protein LTR37_011842 [Vermiconidia calcicola]|uniref:Uncharacterized protein n=1 Tax=Vermiconidia calcicola TaxID=1690605 RepID=A0ACC3N3S2_9PEZI|nr:hypothetical protein LTR37_011842 [Vermiconidia calcicola]